MKIKKTDEIIQMLNRCNNNFYNDSYNKFLGMKITKENEHIIQNKLKKANCPEFNQECLWPSLYLDSESVKSNYHKNIKLDIVSDNNFKFQKETIQKDILFNYNEIIDDPNRELNDYIQFRALKENISTTTLRQNDDVWMLDVVSESKTIDKFACKAYGNVLTMGLGIGYFIYEAIHNTNVKSISVIEYSKEVIDMFKKFILPQFKSKIQINIIQGDAYSYFNKEYLDKFDYVFVDIYKSNDDGLFVMNKMLSNYNPEFNKVDFWIEGSLVETIHGLIFLHFKNLMKPVKYNFNNPLYKEIYNKITLYFQKINTTVDDCETLKHYMYDRKIIREILNTK